MNKNEYILDSQEEVSRLEFQATINAYDPITEIKDMDLSYATNILDAGCGSGIISRYFASKYPKTTINACDISKDRLLQAEKLSKKHINERSINYFQSSLENIKSDDNTYDFCISRFVLQHLEDPQKAVDELYRVCKKDARITLIDIDGVLFNLYTTNDELNQYLIKIHLALKFDLFIGRKLPCLLQSAGFKEISYTVDSMSFNASEMIAEIENYRLRFDFAKNTIIEILNSEEEANHFISLYLNELQNPHTTLFYNKFIAQGVK